MLGLINHTNLIFKTMKITMQDRHLCWPPYFFLGPAMALHFFHSRIATASDIYKIFVKEDIYCFVSNMRFDRDDRSVSIWPP